MENQKEKIVEFKNKISNSKVMKIIINIFNKLFQHPEDVEGSMLEWFDSNKKFSFLTALIVGVITHITFLTDMIMSPDGLWNSITYFQVGLWEASLGRWGLFIANKIVNCLAIPTVTGIASIVIIAISAVFIVDILKLKNKISIFIVSTAMVVSPALTGTMLYMYTSVAYCFAMILSVLTVKLIFKEKYKFFNWILAIAIFTFSLGIYQSYIGVTVGLTAIRLIRDLFDMNVKIKFFFIHGIVMCLIVIIGGLLYSQITDIILDNMNVEMAEYKGMENISISNTVKSLNKTIPKTYKDFKDFYICDNIVTNSNYSRDNFYKIMFLSIIILEAILIISNKVWKNPFRILFIVIMNIILPVALNVILLLTTETSTYILTSAQLILMIPFAVVICDMSGKRLTFAFKWATIISMFLIVVTYYLADNVSYLALKLTYNQSYATAIRIMDRLEQTEGYSPEKPVMIAGIIEPSVGPQFVLNSDLYLYTLGTIFNIPVFHGSFAGMQGTWTKFLNVYLGTKVQYCNDTSYRDILGSQQFREMQNFPAPNSCQEIFGVMVVKLTDTPPMP